MSPAAPLHQLFSDAWETQLQLDPLLATQCGDRRYNDRLPQVGEDAVERQRLALRGFLARLSAIPRAGLSPADQVNLAEFDAILRAWAERELGVGFDRRAFHDLVLAGGPVPLVVLEQQVAGWIERQKRGEQ